ncbi:15187_t:CDS:2, partial [Gigaspora rosea]
MESSSVENKPIFYALTVMEPFAACIIHGVWIAIHVSSSKSLIIKLQCWEQLPCADELKQKNNFGKIIGVARSV